MNKERNIQDTPDHFTSKSESSSPSPFMVASTNSASSSQSSPFTERRTTEVHTPAAAATPTPAPTPAPAPAATYTPAPAAATPFSQDNGVADHTPFIVDEITSSPTQAALRAIFGVDHEMNVDEIVQRLRSLPGIRHLALVTNGDVGIIDGLKKSLGALGFGSANLRIYGGNVPMEFVRHGNTLLAVQTVSGFGPGVKEAIKLATQEIQRLS